MAVKKVFHVVILFIMIGCAVVVLAGIRSADENRKAITAGIDRIGYHAVLHVRAGNGKGGNGVFTTANGGTEYRIPQQLQKTDHASYSVIDITDEFIVVRAISRLSAVGEIVARIDREGRVEML